jgi:hypothetical protein
MEGFMSVVCGGFLFERLEDSSMSPAIEGGGRSPRLWFSLEVPGELRYWADGSKRGAGGVVEGGQVCGVRECGATRRSQGGAVQFSLSPTHGRQRLVRMVPQLPEHAGQWADAMVASFGVQKGPTRPELLKQGQLWYASQESRCGGATWVPLCMQLEERAGRGCVLRYGAASAASPGQATAVSAGAEEVVDTRRIQRVQFGFDKAGSAELGALVGSSTPSSRGGGALSRPRASCQFQFCIEPLPEVAVADTEAVAAATAALSGELPGRIMRLRVHSTRECIDWVHALRRVSADWLSYPELLPTAAQRLLKAAFRRCICNADGSVRATELVRQLQTDRAMSAIFPPELGPRGLRVGNSDHLQRAAAWLFGYQAAGGGGGAPESVTCDDFMAHMIQAHKAALETVSERYQVLTVSEAVQSLRTQWQLPEGMSEAEVVWVVEERMGLPHDHDHLGSCEVAEAVVLLFAQSNINLIVDDGGDEGGDMTGADDPAHRDGLQRILAPDDPDGYPQGSSPRLDTLSARFDSGRRSRCVSQTADMVLPSAASSADDGCAAAQR